jgi:hypothetical protein
MRVQTKAIREGRTLYLLEDVSVPEGQQLLVTIETAQVDDGGDKPGASQETLADVLGFDPADEEKAHELAEAQQQAMKDLAGMFKVKDYPPKDKRSAAAHHDEYIYRRDW